MLVGHCSTGFWGSPSWQVDHTEGLMRTVRALGKPRRPGISRNLDWLLPLAYGCREGMFSSSRCRYVIVKLFSSMNCPAPGDNLVPVGYRCTIDPQGSIG